MESKLPLIVIAGPTASGKTALAIELAAVYSGEIICADSRTIYKDMNIGTAKPSRYERARVPHWGLDIAVPGERFTAADFAVYAKQKIAEIRARGNVPFLVGGTGLYIDGVIFDYEFGPDVDVAVRAGFEKMSLEQLIEYCNKNNITMPENSKNKRYVIRAIEQNSHKHKGKQTIDKDIIVVGIATKRQHLRTRIETRIEQLLADGVVDEAIMLGKKYGWDSEAMTGNIYPLIHKYVNNQCTLDELKMASTALDWQLAKRQLTWFRRNPHMVWSTIADASDYISRRIRDTTQ